MERVGLLARYTPQPTMSPPARSERWMGSPSRKYPARMADTGTMLMNTAALEAPMARMPS